MNLNTRVDGGRRRWMVSAGVAACWPTAAFAHGPLGPLEPPVPAPALPLTLHDGRQSVLPQLLKGRLTALQLMFTGCSATCPVQGAIFSALQTRLEGRLPQAQLLSVSIDPLGDDARALAAWRTRFAARATWWAAVPPLRHADVLLDFVGGRAQRGTVADRHNAQVYLFDAQGRLSYRCAELASAHDIAEALFALSRRS